MLGRLKQWCIDNYLDFSFQDDSLLEIKDIGLFIIVSEKVIDLEGDGEIKPYLFDKEMSLLLDEIEEAIINNVEQVKFYLFEWGGKFYYHKTTLYHKITSPQLFKNVGIANVSLDLPFVNLGIRGEYELLNGMQSYDKWCEKAKFLNQKSLGICEKHTLAGTLAFQMECKAKGIKSIIGETINLRFLTIGQTLIDFEVKLYVSNSSGWRNLLRINNFINVERVTDKYITNEELRDQFKTDGLFCIISNTAPLSSPLIRELKKIFLEKLYYQFDVCELASNERDVALLNNLKTYLQDYSTLLPHIFLSDTFYTEKEYGFMKKKLNGIGKFSTTDSVDQYYKSLDELYLQMAPLFDNSTIDFQQFFVEGCTAACLIEEQCNYLIDLKFLKIPKYPFEIEGKRGEELFYSLIEKGMQEKIIPYCKTDEELQVYFDRIETELEVINEGGFQDYFLILYDILSWCKLHMILYGNGRGSASGCLLAYLFDITKVDPVKYNLLFARFLNKSRIKEGLPDIDIDFMSSRRQEVKDYIIQRFGYENTCFTGTYTTLKLKGALKDIGREMGLDFSQINYITAGAIEEREEWNWFDIFEYAQNNSSVKAFILGNYELINNIQIILNQPKSQSIHASAVIITPTVDQEGKSVNIFDWMPVKLMDGHIVSEWEGTYLDKAGFLKEDILSTSQLDKLFDIIALVKQNRNLEIDPFNLPVDDLLTFQYFQKGLTEDVFHFGSPALKAYCQDVRPDNIQELIAMNALYRPGPMASNAHNDFALIKFGKKQPDYDWGCEEILKPTYGIYSYQEQAIEIVQKIGGFTEAEADNVRRAIGKKILTLMQSYKIQFVQQAIEKGCPEQEAIKIWKKIEDFSAYSFNKSHATTYSLTGYACNYLKVHYPLEFWTTSLQHSSDIELPRRIAEMNKIKSRIKLSPPDINNSSKIFVSDIQQNIIYWSIGNIAFNGDVAVDTILTEREKNGQFYSLKEFYVRIPKKSVNKRSFLNLILAGCFDDICGAKEPKDRINIVEQYCKLTKSELSTEAFDFELMIHNWYWILLQKQMCGFGYIAYDSLLMQIIINKPSRYVDAAELSIEIPESSENQKSVPELEIIVGGVLIEIVERASKKGAFCNLVLDHNGEQIRCLLWNEVYVKFAELINNNKGKIIFISGKKKYDSFRKMNILVSIEQSEVVVL